MRTALAVLLLAATATQTTAAPCDNLPPPSAWAPPTVAIEIDIAPAAMMTAWCHKDPAKTFAVLLGCTYQADVTPTGKAEILLSDALNPSDRACILLYEKAHLPPNNWFDPVMEATAPDDPAKVTHKS